MDEYKHTIKKVGKILLIYVAKETETDPIEKTIELTYMNPIPVKGIIEDLAPNQMIWRLPGLEVTKGKMVVIPKRYKKSVILSHKFEVRGEDETYYGYREGAGKNMQLKTIGNYIQFYIYTT